MSTPLSPQKDAFASPGSSAWDNLQLSLSEESKSAINKLALLAQTPPPLPTKLLIVRPSSRPHATIKIKE